MAGIYIHVPFCAKRCIYCDFFSNTEMKYKEQYISAICDEIEMRQKYPDGEIIETIYFGGGTPSQLQKQDFEKIFEKLYNTFNINESSEITLEVNPDDINESYIKDLLSLPFNRISMGIQSFDNTELKFLNRRHTAEQAVEAVQVCQTAGLDNISIDLIYGLPGQTLTRWERNINRAICLDVPHLSAYHLTYEEGTKLYQMKEKGIINPIDEDNSIQQFSLLRNKMVEAGYLHYEISNFAKPGFISRHNSSYWTGKKYIGLGPSAHSYNQQNRQFNISSLSGYLKGINQNRPVWEIEQLDVKTCYNDYVITTLRTMWGTNLSYIKEYFGDEYYNYCLKSAYPYLKQSSIIQTDNTFTLTPEGMFISDAILRDLIYI